MTFDSFGYEDLRQYVRNNWEHIAIVDDSSTEQLRIDVPNDSRATVTSDSTSNPVTVEITLTGQDLQNAGATLPVTITRTETYKTDGASTRTGSDSFTDATFEASSDEVVITHNYRLPP